MAIDHRTRSLDDEGHRRSVHPDKVRGRWQWRRDRVQAALIVFFLALPWIRIGDRPLLQLNIFERKFSVFGILFQSHDIPLFFFFLIGFALVFAFATAIYGRVWCGWSCPQTVFIEAIFRRIESWIEGPAIARRRASQLPSSADAILKWMMKWMAFLAAALIITHSFLALFVGPDQLGRMILEGPFESPRAFLFMAVSTAVILFDFGWFREQFCIVMCPYGRIQSVFQDTKTLTVAYDAARGEPRGSTRKNTEVPSRGDCVDCGRCVKVCPTGIDIRNGSSQLECIACTACIDACDDVMERLGKSPGLIRFASVEQLARRNEPVGKVSRRPAWMRGRGYFYGSALAIVLGALVWVGERRTVAVVEVFKGQGQAYSRIPFEGEERYGNIFIAEIASRLEAGLIVEFSLPPNSDETLIMPNNPVRVKEGEILRQPFTVSFRHGSLHEGRREIVLRAHISSLVNGPGNPGHEVQEKKLVLLGPF